MRVDIPGIGGSLGECVLCGKPFLAEVLFGKSVQMILIQGMNRKVPIHTACTPILQAVVDSGGNWRTLPDGPLRQEFERATKKTQETPCKS